LGDSLADEVVSALWRGQSAPELIAIKDAEAIARRDPALEKVDLVVARQSLADSVVTDITPRCTAQAGSQA
jgi:hypothetical protein